MKKLGLLAYSTKTGLGVQTQAYYKHLKPSKVLHVDLSSLNGAKQDYSIFPNAINIKGIPTEADCYNFLQGLDVLLVAETPLNYKLFSMAKGLGVRTILVPNYEFNDYLVKDLPYPDLMMLPSTWYMDETIEALRNKTNIVFLPMPVDRNEFKFKPITKAKRFVHIAGRKTFMDRNGTDIFLASIPAVKADVEFIIYSQQELYLPNDPRIRFMGEASSPYEMYKDNDVIVMPRKYGGLCLPLNEALSCGLIPLMTDCEPQNMILNNDSLVAPLTGTKIKTRADIISHETTPDRLATAIDKLANYDSMQIERLNERSDYIADLWSWPKLIKQYEKYLYG